MTATGPQAWLRGAPAARIVTTHLTLRRWRATDIDAITTAVAASIDRLLPWLPWAHGHDRRAAEQFIALTAVSWQQRTDFHYAVVDTTDQLLGGAGLHADIGVGGLQIGYWVTSDAVRRRVATLAAALLTAEALDLDGVTHVEIHHDQANEISGRIPRRLGYEHAGAVPRASAAQAHGGVEVRWRLTRHGYASSMARTLVAGQADTQP